MHGEAIGFGQTPVVAASYLVVGLVLYSASARDPEAPPNLFDRLQVVLVVSALVVDVLALAGAPAVRRPGGRLGRIVLQ